VWDKHPKTDVRIKGRVIEFTGQFYEIMQIRNGWPFCTSINVHGGEGNKYLVVYRNLYHSAYSEELTIDCVKLVLKLTIIRKPKIAITYRQIEQQFLI